MLEICPDAWLLNYANPMAVNCWATDLLGAKIVGLCHSVQGTSELLARELGVPYDEVTFDCAGVNHTAWFTTFRRGDEDLIPKIREVMKARHVDRTDPAAAALRRRLREHRARPSRADDAHRLLPHRVEPPRERVLGVVPQDPRAHRRVPRPALGLPRDLPHASTPTTRTRTSSRRRAARDRKHGGEFAAPIIDSLVTGRAACRLRQRPQRLLDREPPGRRVRRGRLRRRRERRAPDPLRLGCRPPAPRSTTRRSRCSG